MRTVNIVTLLGNIVRTPEKRITASGKSFATFTVATQKESPRYSNQKSTPEFHNVVAWGNLGAIAESFCAKGKLVYVEGYLKTRSWNHENGAKVFRTEIIATNIISINTENKSEYKRTRESDLENSSDDDFFNASSDDFFSEE